jgi:hypothetical protein
MRTAIYQYSGLVKRLRFKQALVRDDPKNEDNYLCQFDDRSLPEAYGWHSHPKKNFDHVSN